MNRVKLLGCSARVRMRGGWGPSTFDRLEPRALLTSTTGIEGTTLAPVPHVSNPFAIVDLDNDAKPDVVMRTDRSITAYLNRGERVFEAIESFEFARPVVSFSMGDFNGDGRLDAAVGTLWTNESSSSSTPSDQIARMMLLTLPPRETHRIAIKSEFDLRQEFR